MKIVILDAASTALIYPGHAEFPFYNHPVAERAIASADVVLSLFTPFAPLIAKGPSDLEVVEYRERTRLKDDRNNLNDYEHGVFALAGSADIAEVAQRKSIDAKVHWRTAVARTA